MSGAQVIQMETLFKQIFFATEHEKGLGRAKKLCLALSITHARTYYWFTVIKQASR